MRCPECGHHFRTLEDEAGDSHPCPACGHEDPPVNDDPPCEHCGSTACWRQDDGSLIGCDDCGFDAVAA